MKIDYMPIRDLETDPIREYHVMHFGKRIATIIESEQPGLWYWYGMGANTALNPTILDDVKIQIERYLMMR